MGATLTLLPSWLGDNVMAVPAIRALQQQGPVVAMGSAPWLEVLQDEGLIDRAIAWTKGRGLLGPWKDRAAIRAAQKQLHCDRVLCFAPSWRSAHMAWQSGASSREGLAGEPGRSWLLSEVHRPAEELKHLADQFLSLAVGDAQPGEAIPKLRSKLDADEAPVVMAPGAEFGPTKRWPLESFGAVASALIEAGNQIVLVGGASRADLERCASLQQSLPAGHAENLAGQTTLLELADLLAGAKLFLGNDSGPMHLAAATGTATLGIFTSTSPTWTAPRGAQVGHVGPPELHCSPCFSARCVHELECLDAVTPAMVLNTLDSQWGIRT